MAANVISTILDWLLERVGVLIFVLVFVVQIVRGLMRSRSETPPEQAKPDTLEEQRRVQEVQAQIRRRIAERRGETPVAEPPPMVRREAPPAPNPQTTQMPEPFGGPLRRVFEELQRQAQPPPPPMPMPPPVPAAPVVDRRGFELERQQKLADQLRSVEESRVLAQRRATQATAIINEAAGSEMGQRSAARGRALDDLHSPESLRRAFVLREVLGTPVGLR